ncbi:MAG: VIT1/CCC1 transporter family protein [Planctomycetota bacterium]
MPEPHDHSPKGIRNRILQRERTSYLSDFVYGAIDGAVTTFAVVSSVKGADLSPAIVLVLGAANLIGDGFSMAAGNFQGTRAENQRRERIRRFESEEIENHPDGERAEVREIFKHKGFEGDTLDGAVETITARKERWIEFMLTEEHGLSMDERNAWRAAGMTLVAFIVVGAIPLVPFVFEAIGAIASGPAFLVSSIATGAAFFLIGAAKSRFVDESWFKGGMDTLFVGSIAAVLAYFVGLLLKGLAA